MLNSKQIVEMAEGLQETVSAIKDGTTTVEEMKGIFPEIIADAVSTFDMIKAVANDEPHEDLDLGTRAAIMVALDEAKNEYNSDEHAKAIKMALSVAASADKDIGEPLVVPMLVEVMELMVPMLENVLPDSISIMENEIKQYKDT